MLIFQQNAAWFESDLSDGHKAIVPFGIHFIAFVMLVFDHLISAHF